MANRPSSDANPRVLLDWYRAAGVDLAVGEEPVDRFKTSAIPGKPAPAQKNAAKPAPAAAAPKQAAQTPPLNADPTEARELAAKAKTLEELEEILRNYDGCALKLRATQLVFGDGNPHADVMFIGEAPGREEDLQGKPFVGRSGQLLDKMMAAIGLDRTKVYIANTVPWRPPGNRTPTPAEISTCLPFLYRQIQLVAPKFIVTLGAPAAQTMFETKNSISRMRGQWRELNIGGRTIKALPTLHPAFLLRQPAQKQLVWRDMLSLKEAIDAEAADQA